MPDNYINNMSDPTVPKYPVYVISKGRWQTRLTSKTLEKNGVPYRIVIEPQEYDQYSAVIDPKKILVLPFSNLGQGSIPARNWVWEHSISEGHEKHWILDDNIKEFYRTAKNYRVLCGDGNNFRQCEDFVDRFTNIKMSGMNYSYLTPVGDNYLGPYKLNTRIYSCILLSNDIDYRWRGKYNEDTDLSIRILKDGWCTLLFRAFLCGKITTLTMSGGNTEELYGQTDDRYEFAKSLYEQHPDVVKIVRRYRRWHHHVDYSKFSGNRPVLKEGLSFSKKPNENGMVLVRRKNSSEDSFDE